MWTKQQCGYFCLDVCFLWWSKQKLTPYQTLIMIMIARNPVSYTNEEHYRLLFVTSLSSCWKDQQGVLEDVEILNNNSFLINRQRANQSKLWLFWVMIIGVVVKTLDSCDLNSNSLSHIHQLWKGNTRDMWSDLHLGHSCRLKTHKLPAE